MMSRWSQTWLPVVMQSTPALCNSAQILAVMPKPAAAFSPLATTKSRPQSRRRRGTFLVTASRPERPTMSPQNRTFMTLDKGASALVGQQPIQPLIARPVRYLGHELIVEADPHGGDGLLGAQAGQRAVIEAAAIAQPPSILVAGEQRHDQRIGLHDLAPDRGLQRAEHARLQRIARPPGPEQQRQALALHHRERELATLV